MDNSDASSVNLRVDEEAVLEDAFRGDIDERALIVAVFEFDGRVRFPDVGIVELVVDVILGVAALSALFVPHELHYREGVDLIDYFLDRLLRIDIPDFDSDLVEVLFRLIFVDELHLAEMLPFLANVFVLQVGDFFVPPPFPQPTVKKNLILFLYLKHHITPLQYSQSTEYQTAKS